MNRGIYATAKGMVATEHWMDAVANNLANVSTNGYKRDALVFSETMERTLAADGGHGRVLGSLGTGPELRHIQTVFELGPTQVTGNPLDVAIGSPNGAFAVKPADAPVRYTRDGAFRVSADGLLCTSRGELVLDDTLNPIDVRGGTVGISGDGTVHVGGKPVAALGIFEGSFQKVGGNLFAAQNPRPASQIDLKVGSLEGSNVNAVEAMVEMIRLNRNFELSHRSVVQQDELTQRLIQSLQNR